VLEAADVTIVGSGFTRLTKTGKTRTYAGRQAPYLGVLVSLDAKDIQPGKTLVRGEVLGAPVG
jgi:hypothetical protein